MHEHRFDPRARRPFMSAPMACRLWSRRRRPRTGRPWTVNPDGTHPGRHSTGQFACRGLLEKSGEDRRGAPLCPRSPASGKLQASAEHLTHEAEVRHEVAVASTVGANQDIEVPQGKSMQVLDLLEPLNRQAVDGVCGGHEIASTFCRFRPAWGRRQTNTAGKNASRRLQGLS